MTTRIKSVQRKSAKSTNNDEDDAQTKSIRPQFDSNEIKEQLLKSKLTIGISLVPTEACLTIITYGEIPEGFVFENEIPDLSVFCITEKTKKTISYKSCDALPKEKKKSNNARNAQDDDGNLENKQVDATIKVTAPNLLWHAEIQTLPDGNGKTNPVLENFSVWEIDIACREEINLRHWLMLNINEEGLICFGNKKPSSFRKAFNMFWTMPFTDEDSSIEYELNDDIAESLGESYESHLAAIKKILTKPNECYSENRFEWDDPIEGGFGQKIVSEDCHGFFISNKEELLEIVPEKFQLDHQELGKLVAGFAKQIDTETWELTFFKNKKQQFTITVPASKVTLT